MTQASRHTATRSVLARRWPLVAVGVALIAACLAAFPLAAKTLRFASAFDPQSLDPHALALQYQTRVVSQIYESLVFRDRNFAMEPALAMSWQQVDPKRWRFKLRSGVKFQDGTLFTADEVVFSIGRALAKNSQRAFQLRRLEARRWTIRGRLPARGARRGPAGKADYVGIMSRAWSPRTASSSRRTTMPNRRLTPPATPTAPDPTSSKATSPTYVPCWSRTRTGGGSAATWTRRSMSWSSRTRRGSPRWSQARSTS